MAISDATLCDVGLIGLDNIGRHVALRLAERQINTAVFDWEKSNLMALREKAGNSKPRVAASLSKLMAGLRTPRIVLVFSGSDAPMKFVLEQLLSELAQGDLLIDAGNSSFKDTARHGRALAARGVQFLAVGLAGGEKGARDGAVVMAGGVSKTHPAARWLLESMASNAGGRPALCHFKTAAAAHFAKMVHAGIEFALLQLISETLVLLQRSLLLTEEELHDASGAYHLGLLNRHLMEISGRVFDPAHRPPARVLLREKMELAKSDPLGKWVVQNARELDVRIPTIEAAVGLQHVSTTQRRLALQAAPFRHPVGRFAYDPESVLDGLHGALHAAMIIAYAQGLDLLATASKELDFRFNLPEITRAWKGCTQLRSTLLDDITSALEATPDLPGLLSDDDLSISVMRCQEQLRHAVWRAHELDAVVPGLLASLDYLDSNRAAWLPTNLIQVPRRHVTPAADYEAIYR